MKRALLAIGCIAILAACGTGGSTAQKPAASRARVAASPDLGLAKVSIQCRLPVLTYDQTAYSWAGGFVTFPGASYQQDPDGVVVKASDTDLATQAQPELRGNPRFNSPFYDLAKRRWLPVGPSQTSPDGSTYIYLEYLRPYYGKEPIAVITVTVATGATRTLEINPPPPEVSAFWEIADFDGVYLYLMADRIDRRPGGVWRLNTTTGALDELLPPGNSIFLVRNGYAWEGWINPADPSPPAAPKGESFDTIQRVSLATGASENWIYRPGENISILGLDDGGHPVVSVGGGPDFDTSHGAVLLLSAPGDAGTQISSGDISLGQMQADVGRIWFGTDQGIYLWTQSTGLERVFADGQPRVPAGHCV